MIFRKIYPNYYCKSAYDIDYKKFYKDGFRAIIYDIDNTLVEHNAPKNEKSKKLLSELKNIGYKVFILSNNYEPRVASFSENQAIDKYYYRSFKPNKKRYLDLSKEYNIEANKFLVIGDQLLTDIWGGNNAGMTTILVDPIGDEILLKIKIKRIFEKIYKSIYKKEFNKIRS